MDYPVYFPDSFKFFGSKWYLDSGYIGDLNFHYAYDIMTIKWQHIIYACNFCIFQVGSILFGNGSTWDEEICDNLDNGNYTDIQSYVQKV